MDINESTDVTIPIRNLLAMVVATSIATMAYFGIQERLNSLEHALDKSHLEIERNTEFRILWPRGDLGSLPADARQDMVLEAVRTDLQELRKLEEEIHELTIRIGTMELQCVKEQE